MDEGRAGVKAVSTVIAAVIVLTVFIGLASAIYTGLFQLSNEASNLVKREAERAMEAFFRIFWINETHVVLFNNHTNVPITLLYWVTTNPATGQYKVIKIDPPISVPPGTMRIVKAKDLVGGEELFAINRVVSERGSSFEVTDAPTDIGSLIYFTPSERIVRPGFNGRLTTFIIPTGPGFGGGNVKISCIEIVDTTDGTTVLDCRKWNIHYAPDDTVAVPPGGVRAIGVNADIPEDFTSWGFYAVKLRLTSAGFTREYVVRVIVTDFSASVIPGIITLTACKGRAALVLTYSLTTYTGHVNVDASATPPLLVWSDPNPAAPRPTATTTTVGRIIVERLPITPTGTQTTTLIITLRDDLGTERTSTLTVVHEVIVITVEAQFPPRPPRRETTTIVVCR